MAKLHSVRLNEDKCVGCTNCIKKCPTEAIRLVFGTERRGVLLQRFDRDAPAEAAGGGRQDVAALLERGGELWKQLQQSGGLALHIAGDFPGLEIECWAIRD